MCRRVVKTRRTLLAVLSLAALGTLLPAGACADATVAPEPSYSSVPGLPDGRVYEEVSPPNKYGSEAGAEVSAIIYLKGDGESVARADGNGILFYGSGPMGDAAGGLDSVFTAERSSAGWSTRSALPAQFDIEELGGSAALDGKPRWVAPSADLSRVMFTSGTAFVNDPPYQSANPNENGYNNFANIYLAGSDPLAAPVWLAKPGSGDVTVPPFAGFAAVPVGGSPDLSTAYFTYSGTLGLPGDSARASEVPTESAWGFYEYRDGLLSDAGVLPDGSVSPLGAVPAALGASENIDKRVTVAADQLDNEVSVDGSRAFFVSPDPLGAGRTELYVRETASNGTQSTVLVSQSQLPGQVGDLAPDGPVRMPNAALLGKGPFYERYSFVYASPDGSHAFFESADRLTSVAPEDASLKMYDFDLNTGVLTYLPGVTGTIAASARDGSSFVFESTSTSPSELERWAEGSNGGSITPIAELPGPAHCGPLVCVAPARISADGSVVVFESDAPISGFNDGGVEQIFRYQVADNELSCVSCPPEGIAPTGAAVLSNTATEGAVSSAGEKSGLVENRGISSDGSRVFFDTPDPLVPQDTDGKRDVYEWENGFVFLISSGVSSRDSLVLDNGLDGSDEFFATVDGLAPGDTEGGYDVYDARVPHLGDRPPVLAVPCQGDVCQGPPSVPSLLGAPPSATFDGVGNVVAQPKPAAVVKKQAKAHRRRTRKKRRHAATKKTSPKNTRTKVRGLR